MNFFHRNLFGNQAVVSSLSFIYLQKLARKSSGSKRTVNSIHLLFGEQSPAMTRNWTIKHISVLTAA